MNEIFKIKENGFNEIKKQLIIKSIPFFLITVSFGFALSYINSKDKENVLSSLLFTIPFVGLSMAYGFSKVLKRQKKIFETYRLVFSEGNVFREQFNTPTVNIQFNDIQSIIKEKKGNYTIKGKTTVETILIPSQIENQEGLELLFDKIKPISNSVQRTFDEKYKIPILLITIFSMGAVYVATNKILVGVCGVLVTVILLRSFFQIKNNKNIDNKTKQGSYFIFLVLASIIAVTIMKITYNFNSI
ncbi:hypothetical protein J2Y38_003681 [Flavobacterium sp. 2755]|uniref:hypothetical protein n=1 Tax=Flavobacterium sp. 2755 TaxID=2817765 RepID=UPI0028577216|nr:hypothetical protein [Flavobacterium sp. 2755]MDR6763460.1 hypothetical protein [Flavobacterium sp. 2755]